MMLLQLLMAQEKGILVFLLDDHDRRRVGTTMLLIMEICKKDGAPRGIVVYFNVAPKTL